MKDKQDNLIPDASDDAINPPSVNQSEIFVAKKPLVKYKAPLQATQDGVIAKVAPKADASKYTGKVSRNITFYIDGDEQTLHNMNVSEELYIRDKDSFQKGMPVVIATEQRRAGITGFIDEAGIERPHQGSGLGFVGIAPSKEVVVRQGISAEKREEQRLEIKMKAQEINNARDAKLRQIADIIASAKPEDKAYIAEALKGVA